MLAGNNSISPTTRQPKQLCLFKRIDVPLFPPLLFATTIVKGAVVNGAKRHRPFIADFSSHGPWLGAKDMVSLTRTSTAN